MVIAAVYDFIVENDILGGILTRKIEQAYDGVVTHYNSQMNHTRLHKEYVGKTVRQLNTEVYEFMESLAPEGYFFGSTVNNMGRIGYFREEE